MHIFDRWTSQFIQTHNPENSNNSDNRSLTEIQSDAKQYFQDLSSSNDGNQNNCLALLVSKMEKPLSSNFNSPKVKALNCLLGATDGMNRNNCSGDDSCSKSTGITLKMAKSLTKFYLEQCGPLQSASTSIEVIPSIDGSISICNENIGHDDFTTDDVRDAAFYCVSSLIQNPLLNSDVENDSNSKENKDALIQFRISVMKECIQKRCASIEYEQKKQEKITSQSDSSSSSVDDQSSTPLLGLSLLPRAKRSLCFGALHAALKGIAIDVENHFVQKLSLNSKSLDSLFDFINFSCSCLYGKRLTSESYILEAKTRTKDIAFFKFVCFIKTSLTNFFYPPIH